MTEAPIKRDSRLFPSRKNPVSLKLNEDGSFYNPRFELYALGLADDLSAPEAWFGASKAVGSEPGKDRRNFDRYRNAVEANPGFYERVNALKARQEEILSDRIYGEAKWAAIQAYWCARAVQDREGMQEAAALMFKIAQGQVALQQAQDRDNPTAQPAQKGSVGRPVAENPQNKRSAADIRAKLVEMKGEIAKTPQNEAENAS